MAAGENEYCDLVAITGLGQKLRTLVTACKGERCKIPTDYAATPIGVVFAMVAVRSRPSMSDERHVPDLGRMLERSAGRVGAEIMLSGIGLGRVGLTTRYPGKFPIRRVILSPKLISASV